MGSCSSKSGAKNVVATPREDELKEGAFKYNKDDRKVVFAGDDGHPDSLTYSKVSISASGSASITSEEDTPIDNQPDSASKMSLLGEIAEYLEDDVSTQVTDRRGSPFIAGRQNINPSQRRSTDTRFLDKERDGSVLHMNSSLIVSPLPFEGEIDCPQGGYSKAVKEVNRDDIKTAINGVDTNYHLSDDEEPIVNDKLNESLKKAQALLGEVSERSDREKCCEETQSVEIVNVLETDSADDTSSERVPAHEHDEISEIFSYDTKECEEDLYWKELRNLSMNSSDQSISDKDNAHTEDRSIKSGIKTEHQISDDVTIVKHIEDNDHHGQDLKKSNIESVPTTETEAESFNGCTEDDRSVATSEWSESMTDLIKLCEEESRAESCNENIISSYSDPKRATFDDPRAITPKTADSIALSKNIPEYPSMALSAVSNAAESSLKVTNEDSSEERPPLSPSIPVNLNFSHEALASQDFSPLAAPLTSYSSEKGPLEMAPYAPTDEKLGVIGLSSPYHVNNKSMTTEVVIDNSLQEKSGMLMAEEKLAMLEDPISLRRDDVISNNLVMAGTLLPTNVTSVITRSSPEDHVNTEQTKDVETFTQAPMVEEGFLLKDVPPSPSYVFSSEIVTEGKEAQLITTSDADISAIPSLDALEKLKAATEKLNVSHALTMSLSSDSASNSTHEKEEDSLISDVLSTSSTLSSPGDQMTPSLHVAPADSNAKTSPKTLLITAQKKTLGSDTMKTPLSISEAKLAVKSKSSHNSMKASVTTTKFPLQKKHISTASKSLARTPKRRSGIPVMKSPGIAKSPTPSPYKRSSRNSSIPSASSPIALSAIPIMKSPGMKKSPRPLSAIQIMKSPGIKKSQAPSSYKKYARNSSSPIVSPAPSPYKTSKRNSSMSGVSPRSITPSKLRSPYKSPTFESSIPDSISTKHGSPSELSLDTESTTPLSMPYDERRTHRGRCASPASVSSILSASSILVRDRQKKTSDRISKYKAVDGCTNRWNPTLYRSKRPCSRCFSLASKNEKKKFEANGHNNVITLTSGGCTRRCNRFVCKDDEHGIVLCRICFNAVHRPAVLLVEETSRSLEY